MGVYFRQTSSVSRVYIKPDTSHSTEGGCPGDLVQSMRMVVNSQALESDRKPNPYNRQPSWRLYSPQMYTSMKQKDIRNTPPTSPINDLSGQEEAMTFLASNRSFAFWGWGGEIECGVIRFHHLLTWLRNLSPKPDALSSCLQTSSSLAKNPLKFFHVLLCWPTPSALPSKSSCPVG